MSEDDINQPISKPFPTPDVFFLRFPEPERSLATTKYFEILQVVIGSSSKLPSQQSAQPLVYVQLVKQCRIGNEIVTFYGVVPEGVADKDFAVEAVKSSIAMNPYIYLPTAPWIVWDSELSEGAEYIEDSFICSGEVFKEPVLEYTHIHTNPPQLAYYRQGKLISGIPSQAEEAS